MQHLDKTLLVSIAEQHGTPVYVYNIDLVIQRYNELLTAIKWPGLKIHYAMKANYNPHILTSLKNAGANLDLVSVGELALAKKLGFPGDRLLYTANNITESEMRQVKQAGVLMNIDSISRLTKFGKAYPGSEVCVRFNPDVVAGFHKKVVTGGDDTKFGIQLEDVRLVLEIAKTCNLKIVGLHEHTGSGIAETEKVYESMKNLLAIATRENFPDLRFIDFGGGFKVQYRPEEKRIDYATFGNKITEIFAAFCKEYGKDLQLYFEPGKFLVAECGYLVIEVNTLKKTREKMIAGTNSGFPQLIRPVFYDAFHEIENLSNPDGIKHLYNVTGNICESGDNFAENRLLPEIREGDLLAIRNAGAYCYSMGGVYNLHPMPSEVIVRNNQPALSRKGLTPETLADSIIRESVNL